MSYTLPPPTPTPAPPPPSSSNRTLWIVLGAIGVVGVCSLLCIAVAAISVLTILGQQTEAVFESIEQDLNAQTQFELPTTGPVDVSAAIAVGITERVGELDITVTDVQRISEADGEQPDPGYQYLAVQVQITNHGAQLLQLENVALWSWLQDEDDYIYDCCVFEQTDQPMLLDELPAGASTTGTIVYEAPDDVDTLYWVYEDAMGNSRVVVRLQNLTANTDIAYMYARGTRVSPGNTPQSPALRSASGDSRFAARREQRQQQAQLVQQVHRDGN